jgi:hypothetical protein
MYSWLCPARARELPRWLWERLRVPGTVDEDAPDLDPVRVCWLDSRPWLPTARTDPEKTPCPPW